MCLMTTAREILLSDRRVNMGSATSTYGYFTVFYTKNALTNIIYFSNIQHHILFLYGLHTLNYGAVTPT